MGNVSFDDLSYGLKSVVVLSIIFLTWKIIFLTILAVIVLLY